MSDEAREAAEAPVHYDGPQAFAWQAGWEAAFDAGVAAGIRQAREAVQREYDDDAPIEPPQYWGGIGVALSAIDALGEDDRG